MPKKIGKAASTKKEVKKVERIPDSVIEKNIAPPQFIFISRSSPFQSNTNTVVLNPSDIPLATYREMLGDPGITYPLEILKLPTLRSGFVYTNPNPDIQKFVNETIEPIWPRLKRDCLTAYVYGFAAMEKRFYRDSSGMARYRRFNCLYPDYIKILVDKSGRVAGLKQNLPQGREASIPRWKSFVYTHQKEFGNHYGLSRLKAARLAYVLDMECFKFHGLSQQDFSVPTIVARAPIGKGKFSNDKGEEIKMNYLDFMQQIAMSIGSRSNVSFPSGEDFSLNILHDKKVLWDFNKDHDFFDGAKARGIFGFEEIYRAGGGSYAKAKEIGGWLIEGIEAIQDDMATEYILPYIIEPIIIWNFWDGGTRPPRGAFSFSPFTRSVRDYLKDIFMKVVENSPNIVDYTTLSDILKVPINKNEKPNPNPGQTDTETESKALPSSKKTIEAFLKKAYNSGIEIAKKEECIDTYIPQPRKDLDLIISLASAAHEAAKAGNYNEINRSKIKLETLAMQRVREFLDEHSEKD